MHYILFPGTEDQLQPVDSWRRILSDFINPHTYEYWIFANIDEIVINIWLYPGLNVLKAIISKAVCFSLSKNVLYEY